MIVSLNSSADAERNAASKANGDFTTPFTGPIHQARSYSRYMGASDQSVASQPQMDTRQSYSYEPQPAPPAPDTAAAPAETEVERRFYSYEPAHGGYHRHGSGGQNLWQYQKTDSRKYAN